jgi:hypothetical protein
MRFAPKHKKDRRQYTVSGPVNNLFTASKEQSETSYASNVKMPMKIFSY